MADLSSIINTAKSYLEDVVHLRVITAVGDFSAKYDAGTKTWSVEPTAENNNAILTDIDLVQGDIVNLVPQALVSDSNAAIRDFHSNQVEKAEGIVKANIAALKGMIEVLTTAEAQNTPPGTAVTPAPRPGPTPGPTPAGGDD